MAGRGGDDKSGPDEWFYVVVALVFGVGIWLLWEFRRQYIVIPTFAIDYAILELLDLRGLGKTGLQYKDYIASFFDGRSDPSQDIDLDTFATVRTVVGTQVRLYISGLIAAMAIFIAFKMKGNGFKRVFSLAGGKKRGPSLALEQARHWRMASVSANFDPDGKDKDITPALTPLEWLRENDITFENGELDRDAAEKAFTEQLGKPWHGVKRAELHMQAVFLLTGMHLLRRENAQSLREDIAEAWSNVNGQTLPSNMTADGNTTTNFVKNALTDEKLVATIDKVCSKHAFTATALITLTNLARQKTGVLPSSDFLWLKRIDRHMWYTLNNIGRRRFFTEGAGAISHFFAEKVVGNAMPEPHIEGAINGIEDYLADHGIESRDLFFKNAEKEEF